ncbi:Bromodomain transcription factor [Euphorbia peplus]|nr:Bromodomain transcription factor [Euphorbia peplus]
MKTRSNHTKLALPIPTHSNPSDFHYELTKIAVSQICESIGFKSTHLSSLQTLSSIAALYIKSVAETAASYSNRSNRTQSNLLDIIHALHDLSLPHGFVGAADLHSNRLFSSKVMKDLSVFVKINDEIPFAKPVPMPERPLIMNSENPSRILKSEVIPGWLPGFPEEDTYRRVERRSERRREVWERSEMVESSGEIERERKKMREEKNVKSDLRRERERVKFKIS